MTVKYNWQIRPATTEDSSGLKRCMSAAYAIYLPRMDGQPLPPMNLDYQIEISQYPTWVAEHDGHIVGGLTMMFDTDRASIANIAVAPEFQGQGLGKGLMNFADNEARRRQYSRLHLATHVLLVENISLYSYLGWTDYDRDEIRVYMRKDLV